MRVAHVLLPLYHSKNPLLLWVEPRQLQDKERTPLVLVLFFVSLR